MTRRGLRSILFCLLAVSAAVVGAVSAAPTAGAATTLPPSGTFVDYHNRVFRLVGGGLVYVSSWDVFGGPRKTTHLSEAQYAKTGLVADGTFIRALPDHAVYRVVGGAPIYVSTFAAFGGPQKYTDVDGRAVDNPSAGLRATVGDRSATLPTFVKSGQDGRVYSFFHGAPIYVHSWDAFGGPKPVVTIDGNAISNAGQGRWRFVLPRPPDGYAAAAVTKPGEPVGVYVFMGGAPVFVPTEDNMPERLDTIRVDARSINAAGGAFPDSLLRKQPADGTFFLAWRPDTESPSDPIGGGDSRLYWVSGGAPIAVDDASQCPGGSKPWTDQIAVDKAGTGGMYDHLAKPPAEAPTPPC